MRRVMAISTASVLTLITTCGTILSSCSSSSGGSAASGGAASGGSGSTSQGSCSATVTGAVTDTVACEVSASTSTSGTTTFEIMSATGSALGIVIEFKGDPADETYTAATVYDSAGAYYQSLSVSWQENASLGVDTSGTFALTLTNPGTSQSLGTLGEAWTGMHGTFTGALPAVAGSTATGTVMFDITF